jgi:hypothetical protein
MEFEEFMKSSSKDFKATSLEEFLVRGKKLGNTELIENRL